MVPVRTTLKSSFSDDPAPVDLTVNEPFIESFPEAPTYLPVPPVMTALPLTSTVVGAAPSCAQPCASESSFTVNVPALPTIEPVPLMESHWDEGAELPVPLSFESPISVPVPVPASPVTVTLESDHIMEIVPLYVPVKAILDVPAAGAGAALFTGAGFFVEYPAGHLGDAAVTTLDDVPL